MIPRVLQLLLTAKMAAGEDGFEPSPQEQTPSTLESDRPHTFPEGGDDTVTVDATGDTVLVEAGDGADETRLVIVQVDPGADEGVHLRWGGTDTNSHTTMAAATTNNFLLAAGAWRVFATHQAAKAIRGASETSDVTLWVWEVTV